MRASCFRASVAVVSAVAGLACSNSAGHGAARAAPPPADADAGSVTIVSLEVTPAAEGLPATVSGNGTGPGSIPLPPPLVEGGTTSGRQGRSGGETPGSLDRGPMLEFVDETREEVGDCYNAALGEAPDLAGDIALLVAFQPDGGIRVEVDSASGPLTTAGVTECVQRVFLGARGLYAGMPEEIRIRLPFSFHPSESTVDDVGAETVAPPATGPLSAEQISPVVQAGQPAIAECYNAARRRTFVEPELRARLSLRIGVDGRIAEASVAADPGLDPDMERCIMDAAGAWRFPASTAPTNVVLPFFFHAP